MQCKLSKFPHLMYKNTEKYNPDKKKMASLQPPFQRDPHFLAILPFFEKNQFFQYPLFRFFGRYHPLKKNPGQFPDRQFPDRTTPRPDNSPTGHFPDRTIPRPDISPTRQLPDRTIPDRQFPERTIPRTDNSPINEEMTGEILRISFS